MPPHPVKDFRTDINGLRALAVTLVLLYHFSMGVGGGFVGVDVFFVISGYLMTRIISRDSPKTPFRAFDFYLARVRRIAPALWAMTGCVLVAGAAWLMPAGFARLAVHARDSLLFVSNLTYTGEAGYFDAAANTKWLLHTWSLAVEWQFYLILPWFFIGLRHLGLPRRGQILVFAVLALAFFANCALQTPKQPTRYFYGLDSRAWELLAGGLVFFAGDRLSRLGWAQKLAELAGLALILASAALASEALKWPGAWALGPVAGAALVLLANRRSRLTGNALAQWLGYRSYSLYLWHWPVVAFLNLCGYWGLPARLAGIAVALLLAELSWRGVEEPGRKLFAAPRQAWIAAALLLGVLAFGLPAALTAARTAWGPFGDEAGEIARLEEAHGDWGFAAKTHPGSRITAELAATAPTKRLTVVLGDSHAEQWFPRIEALAERPAKVLFLTHGGCLPIPGHERIGSREPCGEFASEAWREALALRPQHLLITSSWIPYFFEADGGYAHLSCHQREGQCQPVRSEAGLDALFERFAERVRAARAQGIAVTLLGPIPQSFESYPEKKSRQIAARHLPLPVHVEASPGLLAGYLDEARFRRAAAPIDTRLQRIARETGATFVDPADHLCAKGRCPLTDREGRPLYKDESHLRPASVIDERCDWFDELIFD
ncbi:acyltransferase family protein [Niveibacterium terrae]|uniref:acyltransferase family protein n=1 Tax=Niveibacterium terrae TaxID=3373598 RepID=UPI003A91991F